MTTALDNVLQKISRLRTYQRGERRAPHKPLLLLIAIGELIRGKEQLPYPEVERTLIPLLKAFAPPVQNQPQPELPYWHLVSDGLWTVEGAEALPCQAGGFPRLAALRQTHGHLDSELADVVTTDPIGTELIIERILEEYFPPTIHVDIMAAVGIEQPAQRMLRDAPLSKAILRYRNPRFREDVLRAYEHQCAATGFRAALGGSYFGCEAAHVRWHAYDGPDDVANGIALEPTMHKLFDAGAWTLTDDRRILVSREFTGSEQALSLLRNLHGKPMKDPLPGEASVSCEFIRWHREPAFGGVFRLPALPL
jgi:putative restriction endonuclease